jgi:hypothetical protein
MNSLVDDCVGGAFINACAAVYAGILVDYCYVVDGNCVLGAYFFTSTAGGAVVFYDFYHLKTPK